MILLDKKPLSVCKTSFSPRKVMYATQPLPRFHLSGEMPWLEPQKRQRSNRTEDEETDGCDGTRLDGL